MYLFSQKFVYMYQDHKNIFLVTTHVFFKFLHFKREKKCIWRQDVIFFRIHHFQLLLFIHRIVFILFTVKSWLGTNPSFEISLFLSHSSNDDARLLKWRFYIQMIRKRIFLTFFTCLCVEEYKIRGNWMWTEFQIKF